MHPRLAAGLALSLVACAIGDDTMPGLATGELAIGSRPNIVVIMTDDLDLDGMNTLLELGLAPNIEHYLVDEGIVFDRSFVNNSQCCPSRAIFFTGQYSHNNGVHTSQPDDADGGVDALDDTSTLATWLQEAGYRTGFIGKYLNGYGKLKELVEGDAPQFALAYVPPGWDHWQGLVGRVYDAFGYKINNTVDGVTKLVPYGDGDPLNYKTTALERRATQFIRKADRIADEQPFFLMINPIAPHAEGSYGLPGPYDYFATPDPLDATDKPAQMELIAGLTPTSFAKPSFDVVDPSQPLHVRRRRAISDTNRGEITTYYRQRLGTMLAVDDLVGGVMASLADAGKLDNTVVVFTSDNGYLQGEHRLAGKIVAFDESTRLPLFIRVPGASPHRVDALVGNVDLAATITELAGAFPALDLDGRSLVPYLDDTADPGPWRREVLIEHWGDAARLVPTYGALRTEQYLYVHYDATDERELYDLAVDPFQTWSVHAEPEYTAAMDDLEARLVQMRTCGGGSCQAAEAP